MGTTIIATSEPVFLDEVSSPGWTLPKMGPFRKSNTSGYMVYKPAEGVFLQRCMGGQIILKPNTPSSGGQILCCLDLACDNNIQSSKFGALSEVYTVYIPSGKVT
jgi:hypothetical protein